MQKGAFKDSGLWQFIKFGFVGGINTAVDYLVFALLSALLGVNIYIAQTCGYIAGMLNSYLMNRSFTFKTGERFFSWQLAKFVISNLATLGVSMLVISFFVNMVRTSGFGAGFSEEQVNLLAKLPTVCVTIVLNFVLSRFWVFKNKKAA